MIFEEATSTAARTTPKKTISKSWAEWYDPQFCGELWCICAIPSNLHSVVSAQNWSIQDFRPIRPQSCPLGWTWTHLFKLDN